MLQIVVGIDDSPASDRALDRALLEAEQTGRSLRLVHSWFPAVVLGAPPGVCVDPVSRERLAHHAQDVVDQMLAKGLSRRTSTRPVTVRGETRVGDPGRQLTEASADAALVVLGGKGHGGVVSGAIGSATNYVVQHVDCPVMVVPAEGPPAGRFRHVVVGVDSSACSRTALAWALDAAQRSDCSLLALHCWTSYDRLHTALPGPHETAGQRVHGQAARWLGQQLEQLVPPASADRVYSSVTSEQAAVGLLDCVGPEDLLVVGNRGRGGVTSLLLGPTATCCVEHARSTVVVVRSAQDRPVGAAALHG